MRAKLKDVKFKIGDIIITTSDIVKFQLQDGIFVIGYIEKCDSSNIVKHIEIKVLSKDIEVISD